MTPARFLVDKDVNRHIISGVRRCEPAIEFVMADEAGLARATDPEVLEYAAKNNLLVISHDRNTMTHAAWNRVRSGQPMPGLLIIKQEPPYQRVIDSIILIWAGSDTSEWANEVYYLPI